MFQSFKTQVSQPIYLYSIMAEEDDALGSFFAEIEKIETEQPSVHDSATAIDVAPSNPPDVSLKLAVESKVISKPAEISQKKISHTVYTYTAPANVH